jgi:hypothetical protein
MLSLPHPHITRGPGLRKAVSIGKISDLSQFAKIFVEKK